ncbi:MAG: hypothetical protein LBQ88_02600 [Treponema sp.]|jgi:hypothetical protein|nr:hypothetical protein [Treponema sp.]
MTMIDDATNIRYARFFEKETAAGAMTVLSCWIKSYGIPRPCIATIKTPLF